MKPEPTDPQSRESVGLADTSVFIARESGRSIGPLPERLAVSAVTLGELQLGVLAAPDRATRARRAETLDLVRRSDPIPIGEAIMSRWAQLARDCALAGRSSDVKVMDALIAATAIEHGLPVVTQDDDFDILAAAHPALDLIKV
jgi:predicted nucleic acid-binding protein